MPRDLFAQPRQPKDLFAGMPAQPIQTQPPSTAENVYSGFVTGAALDPTYGVGSLVPKGLSYATSLGGNFPNPVSDFYAKDAEKITQEKQMIDQGYQDQYGQSTAANLSRVAGNIASTLAPSNMATSAIGAAAPVLTKAPIAGQALSGLAKGIGASRGLVGIPVSGAVQGGASTLITEGNLSGALPGAAGAGVLGALGKVAKPIGSAGLSAAGKGYNALLEKTGINLTAAQKTGSKTLELIDSVLSTLPFTAGTSRDVTEAQLRKFTSAAMQKAGLTGDDFTPAVREAAENQFNQRYGNLINNEIVNIDQPVLDVVADISAKQIEKLPTNVKPIVQSYMKDIVQSGGQMTGEAYQAARSQLGQQAKSMAISDPFTANVLKTLRNSLDDAADRSLTGPKKGAWRELNRQYANYKTIQKSVSNSSENSLEGLISPKRLLNTIETNNKTKGQKGYGDLYGLARAGSGVLSDSVPNSGTAQRQLIQSMLTGGGVGLGAGGVTYGATQDPYKAIAAALLSVGGPKAAQVFINSNAGKQYLTKGIPGADAIASKQAKTMAALLAAQTGAQ
jgi:hypothetical protein